MNEHSSLAPQSSAILDRSRKTRLRLGRKLIPLVVAAAALCVIVVWHRNTTHIKMDCERVESYIVPLREYVQEHGNLPLSYPHEEGAEITGETREFLYLEPAIIEWAKSADRPVVIGYRRSTRLIGQNGHATAVYDQGDLRVEWIRNPDLGPRLSQQRKMAGIEDPPKP